MGTRILFLGPPGSGKGTQANRLACAIGVPHISTGEMLRQNVAARTQLGLAAQTIMAAGDLVPDEIVVAMVKDRLSWDDAARGYVLDGFPRNVAQAAALDGAVGEAALEAAILLKADPGELVSRLLQRGHDEGREDDNEASIRNRQDVYQSETAPLGEYYLAHSVEVHDVDGMGAIDEVFGRIMKVLEGTM